MEVVQLASVILAIPTMILIEEILFNRKVREFFGWTW
jgi:hypothetical protein